MAGPTGTNDTVETVLKVVGWAALAFLAVVGFGAALVAAYFVAIFGPNGARVDVPQRHVPLRSSRRALEVADLFARTRK